MDEPSNDRPTGFLQECGDLLHILMNWEIYGFPIGVVVFVVIWFGLGFGFLWLLDKLGIKISNDHSVGG